MKETTKQKLRCFVSRNTLTLKTKRVIKLDESDVKTAKGLLKNNFVEINEEGKEVTKKAAKSVKLKESKTNEAK